mgnify:CR=1 FL=1
MGIPSYFSYIVKNHSDIIKKINYLKKIDNFYLDSNSIIYDTLRLISNNYKGNDAKFEKILIKETIKKINEYISLISPTKTVIIAFDGVAPVAKLEQQRTRRYKSYLMDKITKSIKSKPEKTWDKTAITPGTKFMEKLGKEIKKYYKNSYNNVNNVNIIVSTSDDVGEGEHKIFEYIRENQIFHSKTTTLIYGLDADLIMLCLNHLNISKSIYLYRETPEFIKTINRDLEPNENYYGEIYVELRAKTDTNITTITENVEFNLTVQPVDDSATGGISLSGEFLPNTEVTVDTNTIKDIDDSFSLNYTVRYKVILDEINFIKSTVSFNRITTSYAFPYVGQILDNGRKITGQRHIIGEDGSVIQKGIRFTLSVVR